MEEESPSKPSVAELAGRFKGHILPTSPEQLSFRRRPPCSLKLQHQKDENEESDKTTVSPTPFRMKGKNSSFIEKLQANLALSPTSLLPSSKSPEVKLQPRPLSPPSHSPESSSPGPNLTPTHSPLSPTTRPSHQANEEEDPVSFSTPPEGAPLTSFNKTRARLSFKRRPPTRHHRRSAGEDAGLSQYELCGSNQNGDIQQVLDSPSEEDENRQIADSLQDAIDCENTENGLIKIDPNQMGDLEQEQVAEKDQYFERLEAELQLSELCSGRKRDSGLVNDH